MSETRAETGAGETAPVALSGTANGAPAAGGGTDVSVRPAANDDRLSSLSKQGESFVPSAEVKARALVTDFDALRERASADPQAFWAEQAEQLEWFAPWTEVLQWEVSPPEARWFVGGRFNITVNALDRHVRNGRRNKVALLWVGEPQPDGTVPERALTYDQLLRRVNQCANALQRMGVQQGDRVTLYMALTPELPIAMLACARIGAIHSVVYGGFSAPALRSRIEDSQSKVVICTDVGARRGKRIDLKGAVDEAVQGLDFVHKVLVHRRDQATLLDGVREVDFDAALNAESRECEPAQLDSETPMFFLYTSGTTGKPKGVVHVHGGYAVGTSYTHKICFDYHEDDIYWCTADPGWITGHSYVVYGPLVNGATVLMAEGALDYPDAGRWWSIVERYGVNIFYSTPTAIRALMRFGEEFPARYDLSSLTVLGTVGEPINPEAWLWYHKHVGRSQVPIVDTWWQTETGQFMIATVPSYPTKPGSPGKPLPGIEADVVDRQGQPVEPGKGGFLVLKTPWPAMMRTIYKDPERYERYWTTIPGLYSAGDVATRDADGYFRVMGRADDVMNVSGYRIGTAEVESALVSHPAVAEAAVIGKPDAIKGETIKAFVILRQDQQPSAALLEDLKLQVRTELGPIAIPAEIEFVASLPKTRSGKIMRRVLKAKELGVEPGDISTLED